MRESLPLKYRPKTWDELVEQSSIKTILDYQLDNKTFKNAYLFSGASGCGKAQPNFCKVKTEYGDIEIGNIKVGTEILGSDGKSQVVTNVYPQGMREYVRVDFTDGTYTYCDYDHLWTYTSRKGKTYTKTIREIEQKHGNNFRITIPTISPVQYEKKDLPIHPYVLGALLGNGNFGHSTSLYDYYGDVYAVCKELLGDTVIWKEELNRNCPRYSIHNSDLVPGKSDVENIYNTALRTLGLWGTHSRTKFIPQLYLYGSIEQRIWLLRGLLDTDGSCVLNSAGTRCKVRYTSVSTQLRDDIKYLCRSLGITVQDTYKTEDCMDISIISRDINPFYIKRKADKYRQPSQNYKKVMCHIEPMGKTECTCIKVSNEDELYITNDFIVTHNTTSARIFASMINSGKGVPIELDAASNNGVDDVRRICEEAQTQSLDSEYKVIIVDEAHMITQQGWNAMLKTLEEPPAKSIFILCTTDPQKIPITILGRVERYNFQRISLAGIEKRIDYVIHNEMDELAESWVIERGAISYIARLASGQMRDALSLLDKCISYSKDLTVENVVKALGVADYSQLFGLLNTFYMGDTKAMWEVINEVYNSGADLKQFIKTFLDFLLDVCKFTLTEDYDFIKIPDTYDDELKRTIGHSVNGRLLKIIVELNSDLKWEKDVKTVIDAKLALFIQESLR